ncbi:hypothetical protein ACFE04_021555 [Oxalis oulophora]
MRRNQIFHLAIGISASLTSLQKAFAKNKILILGRHGGSPIFQFTGDYASVTFFSHSPTSSHRRRRLSPVVSEATATPPSSVLSRRSLPLSTHAHTNTGTANFAERRGRWRDGGKMLAAAATPAAASWRRQ